MNLRIAATGPAEAREAHHVRAERTDAIAPDREAKDELHEQFARIGRALANSHRVEILDLLAQGERGVEVLAARAGISVGLASAHLQGLRRAGLVVSRRDGTRILYRLAGDDVYELLAAVRSVATGRIADAERAARAYMGEPMEAVTRVELLARVRSGDAVVVDLRPSDEYEAGHIAGAISIPLADLEAHLAELPAGVEIVAYCRGPYCALAPQGVSLIRRAGRRARRLEDGFPEWRLAGLPVATGRLA
jgi:rhodanese-related sulfurtransferase/DNA-binding transcriptional ArsR family regulator